VQIFSNIFKHFTQLFERFRTFSNVFARFCQLHKKAIVMALWTKAGLCGESSLSEQCLPRTQKLTKTLCTLRVLCVRFFFVPLCLSGYQKSIKNAATYQQKSKNPKFF